MLHRVELSSERYNTLFGRFAHVWDKIRLSTHHKSVIKGFDLVKSGKGQEKTNSILIIFVVYITKSQYGRPSSDVAMTISADNWYLCRRLTLRLHFRLKIWRELCSNCMIITIQIFSSPHSSIKRKWWN